MTAVGATGGNRYLFSTFGQPPVLTATTARRLPLAVAASSLVLGFSLLLIYFRFARRGAALVCYAVGLAIAAALWPDLAVLVLQLGVLGFAVALLGLILRWNFARRQWGRTVVHGRSLVNVESATDSHVTLPIDKPISSTAAVPLTLASPSASSKP